jgi:hypothetical protein
MTWGWVAAIGLLIGLVVLRSRLQLWIFRRWAAGEISDRRGKVLLFLVHFGPTLAALVLVAALARFPWNLLLLLVLLFAMWPSIGLAGAMLDYTRQHVLKDESGDAATPSRTSGPGR